MILKNKKKIGKQDKEKEADYGIVTNDMIDLISFQSTRRRTVKS